MTVLEPPVAADASSVRPASRALTWMALGAVCLLGAVLVARGLTDEAAVSLDGDMPHYLLNGVFLHDLLHDLPLRAPLEYAWRYYARYPALTLGHHPFVPALAEIPFFSVFGISVFSARLTTACAFILSLIFLFALLRDIYDMPTALFGSLLFISTPGILPLYQVVLSEPIALCLILASVYAMHRYCVTADPRAAAAFAIGVVLSAYAKHLAVFIFPVYLVQYVSAFGWASLFQRRTMIVVGAMGLCLVPLVPLTLKYSHWNVTIVTQVVEAGRRTSGTSILRILRRFRFGQFRLSDGVLALSVVAVVAAGFRRDSRILLFLAWVGSVYAGVQLLGVVNERFFVYWVPAFCALAAAALHGRSSTVWRASVAALLVVTVGYQFAAGARDATRGFIAGTRPAGAEGYEEAARYVTENRLGDTVLYSAAVDTGYFVFFVRKADPNQEMVVLRADKMLTTSRMGNLNFKRLIDNPAQIAPILHRFGVGYVIVEDGRYAEGPLLWLNELVKTDDFILRRKIPIGSRDLRLKNATLSVYEYRTRTPADRDARLSIGVPLMADDIQLPLSDLLHHRGQP